MGRIAAKFVPQLLQNEQKQLCLEFCRELQWQLQEDPDFLSKVVTVSDFFLVPKMKNQVEGVKI
jgi:hypothetical protein